MASSRTTVYKGANRITDQTLVGRTIDNLFQDDVIVDALGLDNHETIRVNGENKPKSYVIRDGDAVEFYKASGTKGN